MTASGLTMIYTMDEVNFIQNLVFYIERAYRTPDYGIWERGNKINHGMPELNSSSIGMVVAALQAINGINLFGSRGGPQSVIHVLPDEITRNYTTLHSALPRESASKEIDAAILAVISFPAFAVADPRIVARTRSEIVKKLGGNYGFKRFLRDGHQTVVEDTSRLHYDPNELKIFEGVESEWPLFFTYMILDGLFREDYQQADEYRRKLEPLLVDSEKLAQYATGHATSDDRGRRLSVSSITSALVPRMRLVPELFIVPRESIEAEKKAPGTQARYANENVPLVWAQSLYTLGNLIYDDLLSPAELDPLGRRLTPYRHRSRKEVVVQVVLLAEDVSLQQRLATFGLDTQTLDGCEPVTISNPSALRDAYTRLGENRKLGLTGRPRRPIGTLSTCKLYRCQGRLYAFLPHFMDKEEFYLVSDNDYLLSVLEQELAFVRNHWYSTGRPTMVVMLTREMLGSFASPVDSKSDSWRYDAASRSNRNLLNFMMSLRSGNCSGTRVRLGRLSDMINTACIESLDFLVGSMEHQEDWHMLLKRGAQPQQDLSKLQLDQEKTEEGGGAATPRRLFRRRSSIEGLAMTPLISPWVVDGKSMDNFKLHDHIDEEPSRLDLGAAESPVRVPSPVRKVGNSSFIGCENPDYQPLPGGQLTLEIPVKPDNTIPSTLSPSTSASEILNLTLGDPSSVDAAMNMLQSSANLYDQIDLLHYLHSCHGSDYQVKSIGTVGGLLEEVYIKAMHLKQWSIVRQAAGLLKKVVNSLTINVSDLLIRLKPVTVGFGTMESFIAAPVPPDVLQGIIYKHCASDVREAPLVQEVLIYLGSFIRTNSAMFEGIMRIRTHFFIIAMREEITRIKGCDEEEAIEHLMQLSPFEMKSLLGQVLGAHEQANSIPEPLAPSLQSRFPWRSIHVNAADKTALRLSEMGANLPSELLLLTQSGGFSSGNFSRIEVVRDGQNQPLRGVFGRGLNVAILDPFDGSVLERIGFDTHASQEESNEFARLIEWLDPGTIVAISVMDDAAEQLSDAARAACESLGSSRIRELRYRDSWCIIGEKGAERGSVPESHRRADAGMTETIQKTFDLGHKRRMVLAPQGTTFIGGQKAAATLLLPSQGRWLRRRMNDGALNRVPPDFYPKVWKILSQTKGILIGKEFMPRDPTVSEKTPEEFNFALQVEHLLDVIPDPAERQIAVECLVVISRLSERNPELHLSNEKTVALLPIIREAMTRFWDVWVAEQQAAASALEKENANAATSPQENRPASPKPLHQPPPLLSRYAKTGSPSTSTSNINLAAVANGVGAEATSAVGPQDGGRGRLSPTISTASFFAAMDGGSDAADWSYERNEKLARRLFFDLPQEGKEGTLQYLASSCVSLVFDVRWGQ
ncbi:hypothetical protein HDV00_002943 [Rhizophlyctis rosea]|nr:hypothetical protein HDV00_002943 [Rhizophlyctis rosea]